MVVITNNKQTVPNKNDIKTCRRYAEIWDEDKYREKINIGKNNSWVKWQAIQCQSCLLCTAGQRKIQQTEEFR